jgi:hypothetical protein
VVELRGWWIVQDAVSWIFIAIVCGMAVFGAWPRSPYDLVVLAGLVLACVWALLAWRSVRARRRPPDASAAD